MNVMHAAEASLEARASRMGDYGIARTQQEALRLNKQHRLYGENLGFDVHPTIMALVTPSSLIADIGTGTGVFLVELASRVPATVRLDGFDISAALLPAPGAFPDNVRFPTHDARTPFPSDLHGLYDIVHLRLLVAGLREDDWRGVAANAMQLLRPGGRMQWVEADHSRMFSTVLKGNELSTTRDMARWGSRIVGLAVGERARYGWSTLEDILTSLGLEEVVHEVVSSDNRAETRRAGTEVQVGVCESMARLPHVFEEIGGEEGMREMCAAMARDQASGAYLRWDIHVFLGVKAAS